MGDVTPEMTAANRPLYARAPALALIALAVAGGVVALVLALGGGGGRRARNAQAAAPGEIELTSLSAQQLRPVGARVDRSSIHLRPRVVKVAGVGTGEFIDAGGTAAPATTSSGAPTDQEVRRQLAAFKRDLRSAPGVPVGEGASVQSDGSAVAPLDAPNVVAAVIQAANAIAKTPYKWGGGHGAWADTGYDCSGSVSFALAGAGLLASPLDSTRFEGWGAAGPGHWITVYANAGHAFMVVAGLRFDTSGRTGSRGTRWQPAMRSTAGFVARHPPGL